MEPDGKEVQQPPTEPLHRSSHTYADDLSKALDTTDAVVVQEILSEGRAREELEKEEKTIVHQRKWYKAGAIVLLVATTACALYTAYHYSTLTVPAQKTATVGVFPSTDPIVTSTTDIRKVVETLQGLTTLSEGKPSLVPLVSDDTTLTLLSNKELFDFFESKPSEPFLASYSIIRLGVMNNGVETIPFVIASMNDPEIAAKELLIAEPDLLNELYKPLGIDMSSHVAEIGKAFTGEYMYNIPVRTLRYDSPTQKGSLLFFYAKVSDQIVVFTTDPSVLKAIYDSLVRQHA